MDYFKILPVEIALDILSRLPTDLVLDCKLVCTNWRSLVSHNPLFSQMHLLHLNGHPGKLGFLSYTYSYDDDDDDDDDKDNGNYLYFEYNENHRQLPTPTPIQRIRRINLTLPMKGYSRFVGSCNGLICFARGSSVCVCNPITKEQVMLPKIKKSDDDDNFLGFFSSWAIGFGYASSTDEYKIVGIHTSETAFVKVYMYTLGSGHGWRKLGKFYFKSSKVWLPSVFVSGAVYWLDKEIKMIITFDLDEEKFCDNIAPPPLPTGNDWCENRIGVLDGFLFLDVRVVVEGSGCYDIWILKKKNNNHDVKEVEERHQSLGWVKEYRVDESFFLAVTKSDGVLTHIGNYLNIYDTKTLTSKRLVKFKGSLYRVNPHKNTFVSLKDLGEEDTTPMESVEMEEARSPGYTFEQLQDDANHE